MTGERFNILLLGMGGEVSKGILKAIRHSGVPCTVIGACVSQDSNGLFFCDKAFVSPYASDSDFVPWLIDTCNREGVDMVMTGVEENLFEIASNRRALQNGTQALFRVSTPEQLGIGGDKYNTCLWLQEKAFPHPRFARAGNQNEVGSLLNSVGFPLIAKPRYGKGSTGVMVLKGEKDLADIVGSDDYVVEEYVGSPDDEYTVGCYRGMNGEMPTPIVMRRRLQNGSSAQAEVVENDRIAELASRICEEFKPDGPLNIQLRLTDDGTPVPFEFNVRFSGTTPMRAHFGFCDVKAMLYESLLGKPIDSCFNVKRGMAFRYTEELYLTHRSKSSDGEIVWEREQDAFLFREEAGPCA